MDTPDFKQPITANKILRPSSNPSKTTIMTKQQPPSYNKVSIIANSRLLGISKKFQILKVFL